MRQLLLLSAALLLVPAASAQTFEWVYDSSLPIDADIQFNSTHGIAVDPDGKIWISPFSATDSVLVPQFVTSDDNGFRSVRALYVLNSDGTPASFSPLKFVQYADGTTPADTLGGFVNSTGAFEGRSGRGLAADTDGNILASMFDTLFKLDYQTGQGLASTVPVGGNSLTASAGTPVGNVFITAVVAGDDRIVELNGSDLSQASVVGTPSGFNRSIVALDDGNTVISLDYTVEYSKVFTRPDAFSAFDSTFATFYGMAIESATVNPDTRQVWVSSGSANDTPNRSVAFATNWRSHTWYAFDQADLLTNEVPTPMDSLTWNGCDNFTAGVCDSAPEPTIGRPRAIAFSPDGQTAYVGAFSQLAPSVQKFVRQEVVSTEPATLADGTTLDANHPNPFSGSTTIRFELANAADVAVRVYDVMGREVATLVEGPLQAGPQSATFDATGLAAGTYLYTLEVDGQRLARRMLLAR
ncbi:MAG: T9SS type A sorting domain-containing protein [Bacteroidota bacterium]